MELTVERLKAVVHYDPSTGLFTRLITAGPAKAGSVAGCKNAAGYIIFRVDGKLYYAHRLAWFYMTGEWPDPECDHEDKDRSNNRWGNLRPATHGQNQHNRAANKSNETGINGAHWSRVAGRWSSRIMVGRNQVYLGLFDTPEEAGRAYACAAAELHCEFAGV